jgi:exopolyphosphatase / guanosine-5'-triphosphate,3'-diphosphate pyrophosphatase
LIGYWHRRRPRREATASSATGGAGGGAQPVYAALDLGTNNCRLLVATAARRGFEVIDSFSRIVRLGEGLQASGRLSEAAIGRSIAALRICAQKIRRRRATRLRCVATEACREAANCREFVDRVEAETGVALEIIDWREEATLAMHGCGPLLDRTVDRAVVFDIGGGSSEVMWLDVARDGRPRLIDCVSVPWGVVRMAERFGGREVTPAGYEAMVEAVRDHLGAFEARHGIRSMIQHGRVQMLGTSGTVTTVAGVHLELERYMRHRVDGQLLTFDQIERVTGQLRAMSFGERAAHPCVGPERADLVLPGCAVLDAIVREWPVGRLRVADRGVREGILFSLISSDKTAAPALRLESEGPSADIPGAPA